MGSLFRSEDMTLCQLYLQAESAYACVSELGELGVVQFKDLNSEVNAFQKKFVSEVRRCEEMERQLRYFMREIKKEDIDMLDPGTNPEAPAARDMVDLEATFEKLEGELKELSSNTEALRRNDSELNELKQVLRHMEDFFHEQEGEGGLESVLGDIELSDVHQIIPRETETRVQLDYVAGAIDTERLNAFTRLLWFACRGNVFIRHAQLQDHLFDVITGEPVRKSVFTVFFQGERLKARIKKICEGFHASLYPCPETAEERRSMVLGVMSRLEDLKVVLEQSNTQRKRVLTSVAQNLKTWYIKVRKIKAIYHVMNMFLVEKRSYIAECWCPVTEIDHIKHAMNRATDSVGSTVPSILNRVQSSKLPTYNRVNKFTRPFQTLIDAYGVANYREVNPAGFSIITFPFLFAVMFGDAGHGMIMFLFGLWMVVKERTLAKQGQDNEIWRIFFGGRYLILLMGMFSMYTGLIYNDVFSKSVNIFGSSWRGHYDNSTIQSNKELELNPNSTDYLGYPYPFGLDPIWQVSKNKISFTNSLKKKLSIILGVVQMLFGIILSLFNHIHFRKPLNIICEFVPQVLFLMSIFGYLIILVFVKWVAFTPADAHCAPNLLIGLINMFLFKHPKDEEGVDCSVVTWYAGQEGLEIFLVVLAALCVPWMLLVKPLILRHLHTRIVTKEGHHQFLNFDPANQLTGESSTDDPESPTDSVLASTSAHTADNEEFVFGDTLITQAIHTIEFCLGCISNTASYLRLWALSLAHSQLSEVLWSMVFRMGLTMPGYVGAALIPMIFPAWAALTVAILVFMEGVSAFLHALRLHWVEFQNKFYSGEGFPFEPFSFTSMLATDEEES